MRRISLAVVALISVLGTSAAADPQVVVVQVTGEGIDAARMRAAMARELGATVVAPDDARATSATQTITVDRSRGLTVTVRRAGGTPISRSVALPQDIEGTAVLLAGNLARNEADEILASMKKRTTPNELTTMSEAVAAYEKGAREYRDAITDIVRLHYDVKKREALAKLDDDLRVEKEELAKARATAIARLEAFVGAHPHEAEATPDALYRLAALYDEAGRGTGAIVVYRRLLRDFPSYRETPGVQYFLGHALNDADRSADAREVWRALVESERGKTSKYAAEVWWQLGNFHFDAREYEKAEAEYTRALAFRESKVYGPALYKHAWTLYKQERWEAAAKDFVRVLRETEGFRDEAIAYVAAAIAEMRAPIERVKDPTLLPQDAPWTPAVYRALASELAANDRFDDAIALYEQVLARWPTDANAPATENAIAEAWDQKAVLHPAGSVARAAVMKKALEARTKLARYVGTTPWTLANKDDPSALRQAETLARGALRRAAAIHTNDARAALAAGDRVRALETYRFAATAWAASGDEYEARYWLADARHQTVKLAGAAVTKSELADAISAAVAVRDATDDDRFLESAAFFVVDLRDVARDLAYADGTLARRDAVVFDGADPATRSVVTTPIPDLVQRSIDARVEYVRLLPKDDRTPIYQQQIAETFFLYGQWGEARTRFEAQWRAHCGVDPWGARAWERLVTMAAAARDEARALALVDAVDPRRGGRSCDAETERRYVGPIQREVALAHGKRLAEKKDWAAAATTYETYLRTHEPDADVLESLAGAYLALFDHPHAADAYARLANDEHAAEPRRREAAMQALLLFTADGESEKARAEHRLLAGLHPTADERATADYRIAGLDGDAGMARFWEAHRADATPSSRGLLVEAAHAAGRDRSWHSRTLAAWDALAAVDSARAQRVPFVDDGAEAAFALADADARATTDAWSKRPLPTTAAETFARHRRDADEAKRLDARLRADVIDKMRSPAWVASAVARQGAIWDALRTSLYDVTKVKTLDARGEALVALLKKSGQEARAGELEDTANEVWRARKTKELDAVEALLVARYATAVAHAQKHGVKSAEIMHALSRLAYFTDLLGDAKMRAYVTSAGLPYDDHMYVTKQPGLTPRAQFFSSHFAAARHASNATQSAFAWHAVSAFWSQAFAVAP